MRTRTMIICRSAVLLALLPALACTSRGRIDEGRSQFRVSFVGSPPVGSEEKPLPFSAEEVKSFTIDIEAVTWEGGDWQPDSGFDGQVVVTVQPTGRLAQEPQNVRLTGGRARVNVGVRMAFGPVRLVVIDPGYVPAAEPGKAACNANRLDEEGDGFADYPLDRGCYTAGDDTETGGGGGTGASPVITFANPRIADVQRPGKDQDKSALKDLRVTVDKGLMLVSRISTDGLYITDYDSARWDTTTRAWVVDINQMFYRSLFAYNFSTPLNIQEGDCLVQLDGTVEEFYNYTELGKPTWKKGDYPFCATLAQLAGLTTACNPKATDEAKVTACRVELEALSNTPFDLTTLLVEDRPGGDPVSVWDKSTVAAERFESALVQLSDVEMFTEVRTCDRNGNGVVDFGVKDEADCSNACGDEPGCIIQETYNRYKQWSVHFTDGKGIVREVTIVTQGAIPKFDPMVAYKANQGKTPKKLGRVVGTMRDLSFGRPRWTLEPRRPSDCPDCVN